MLHSCFRVLYISDEQERNKAKTRSIRHTTTYNIAPASHPYKEGPHARGNGASTQDALEDKDKDQRIYHPVEGQAERLLGGVGRPHGSAEPGLVPVQVHFEEWLPRHLITFHICVGGKPTFRAINRAPSHPSQHTHTSFHSLQEGSPLSCSLR